MRSASGPPGSSGACPGRARRTARPLVRAVACAGLLTVALGGTACAGTPDAAPPAAATSEPSTGAAARPDEKPPAAGRTPVAINGRLRVCGVKLCNRYGRPIQLRGMSSHGIQWSSDCVNDAAMAALATDWKADVFRTAMYVQEGGYETDPRRFTDLVHEHVELVTAHGMYVIVDFHILTPGDPNHNVKRAKTFFAEVARRHADKPNIIYEIANEPNGVGWGDIKRYAEQVIPVIRAADPDAVVLVGTRAWSSLGISEGGDENEVINDPVDASNIMYTFHFYAATHQGNYRDAVTRAARRLPLFVAEFGTQTATGAGGDDLQSSQRWITLLNRAKISWVMWNWSDIADSSGALTPGTCDAGPYTGTGQLKKSGAWIRERIRSADRFPTT